MWFYLPLRLFKPRYKLLSTVKFPISIGTLPSKELLDKDKNTNSLHLNRLLGMLPAMRLLVLKPVFYKWRYIEDWERYGTTKIIIMERFPLKSLLYKINFIKPQQVNNNLKQSYTVINSYF